MAENSKIDFKQALKLNPYDGFDWEVHVVGPDDVHECKSFEEAVNTASAINATCIDVIESGNITGLHPVVYATIRRRPKSE